MKNSLVPFNPSRIIIPAMFLSFIIWVVLYFPFLSNQKALINDAVNYFEHTSYYFLNLSRGIYPFWESYRDMGVPTEFFMRRIGEFNPFYLIILIPLKLGAPPLESYLAFMAGYFFLGMIGFYKLAKLILGDWKLALVAFWGLMFSGQGTQMFCSFTHLIFVPMFWFFYFLLSFLKEPVRFRFLGAIFCLMILACTYIPFYFITVFLLFVVLLVVLFLKEIKKYWAPVRKFLGTNKIFAGFCLLLLVLSVIPGIQFYQDSHSQELAFPLRHYGSQTENAFGVAMQRGEFGGIIPHLVVDEMFFDLNRMHLSRVYAPWFIDILFFLGLIVALNRRMVLLFVIGYSIFIISLYDATIYKFLYDHIFYFKYFRNFQFFFWLAVLPIYVLLGCEHLRAFLNEGPKFKSRPLVLLGVVLIHAGFIFLLIKSKTTILSSYVSILFSFLFFAFYLFNRLKENNLLIVGFLALAVLLQPIEVLSHLPQNSLTVGWNFVYRYESGKNWNFLKIILPGKVDVVMEKIDKVQEPRKPSSYVSTPWYDLLKNNLNKKLFDRYSVYRFLFYDRVKYLDKKEVDLEMVGQSWQQNKNIAFVFSSAKAGQDEALNDSSNAQANIIHDKSKELQIIKVNPNEVELRVFLDRPQFLVWNDNYDRNWRAQVNGKPQEVYQANISFKGVFVPAGESSVIFKFGSPGKYLFKFFMIFLYLGVLAWIFILMPKNVWRKAWV